MAIKSIMGAVCATIISINVNAAIVYDENIDGDIDSANLGALGAGLNSVTGVISSDGFTADFDNFIFQLLPGQQLSTFTVDFSEVSPNGEIFVDNLLQLHDGSQFQTLFDFRLAGSTSSPIDLLALAGGNLDSGFYAIVGGIGVGGSGGDINYTYSMEVSSVPVPAAVWLFGSGLIGLVGLARRKKT